MSTTPPVSRCSDEERLRINARHSAIWKGASHGGIDLDEEPPLHSEPPYPAQSAPLPSSFNPQPSSFPQ